MIFQNTKLKIKKVLLLLFLIEIIILFNSNINPRASIQVEDNQNSRYGNFEYLKISDTHNRIHINNNWTDAKIAGTCSGSGNFTDPFVITDLIINGNGTGVGILIEKTMDYFRIENCTVYNCQTGIRLSLVNNGTLYRNNCSNNENGISISIEGRISPDDVKYDKNNTIQENIADYNTDNGIMIVSPLWEDSRIIGNVLNNNQYGLNFHGTNHHNNSIIGNSINRNSEGIRIMCHGNNAVISNNTFDKNIKCAISFGGIGYVLTGNLMKGSGLALGGANVEYYSLLDIDTSNLVNNKYIYYYINKTDLKQEDFNNAGQIFLINCTNSEISNLNLSNSTQGISLFHSNNITVTNVNSSYNMHGMYVYNTNNSMFIRNILNEGYYNGIYLAGKNNTIAENDITNNGYGIELDLNTDYNIISENYIIDNIFGIWIRGCRFNTISGNIVKDNIAIGIRLIGGVFACRNNNFFQNFFIRNGIHVEGSTININDNAWNTTEIGNYWDNYTGFDNNGDGIGDTPHLIDYSSLISDYLPIVDNLAPVITINSPNTNQEFVTSPMFNIRVEENYLDVMWYTLDSGLHNFTFTENSTINQNAWNSLPYGSVNLQFYAMDKTGKIGYAEITIIKNEAAIPGYNVSLLLMSILFFGLIIVSANHGKLGIRKN